FTSPLAFVVSVRPDLGSVISVRPPAMGLDCSPCCGLCTISPTVLAVLPPPFAPLAVPVPLPPSFPPVPPLPPPPPFPPLPAPVPLAPPLPFTTPETVPWPGFPPADLTGAAAAFGGGAL